ncbi:N-acetyltransferase [bacterium]|nr:N-acetyltransferase [bacterium]
MILRKAKINDVKKIYHLINHFAQKGEMLPRSQSEIYENMRDFFVVEENGDVVGCCALHILWDNLAEVKSLAVAEEHQGKGIGRMLVNACLNEARELGINKVFALTFKPAFFQKLGFRPIGKDDLPRKVWGECIKCPFFPDCKEEAMIIELK